MGRNPTNNRGRQSQRGGQSTSELLDSTFQSEIHRVLDRVDIREKLDLLFQITEEEYQSSHEISGTVEGVMTPDNETKRDRQYPPVSIAERLVSTLTGSSSLALETKYPGTEFYVGLVRDAPSVSDDESWKDDVAVQQVNVDGLPKNDTIKLGKNWEMREIEDSLAEDKRKSVSREYDITDFPSEQVPIVIRGNIYRDAREYIEQRIKENIRMEEKQKGPLSEAEKNQRLRPARRLEGVSVLTVEIEYRSDGPEAEVGGGGRRLKIENFQSKLSSTFSDLKVLNKRGEPVDNHTYNPEKKTVEWRGRTAMPGESIHYNIFGPVNQLLDIESISASFRGEIRGQTLTGTRIFDLYDEAGRSFTQYTNNNTKVGHKIKLTGDIEIDPNALIGKTKTHTSANIQIEEHPEEAFDKLEAICQQEGINIIETKTPGKPEPVTGRENVFEISAAENMDGDDRAGRIEVKREFGDEGLVYADIQVTGQFTTITQQSKKATSEESDDNVVREDQGGLETRGKTTVRVKARSASSDLNTELINKIERNLRGAGQRSWDSQRDGEERLESRENRQFTQPNDKNRELTSGDDQHHSNEYSENEKYE